MAIKVSAKTVAQLRKGTMAGNLAKAKGASPEMREALNRFYGTKRVNAASGPMKAPTQATKATPETAKKKPVVPAQAKRAGVSQASKTPAKKVTVPAQAKRAGTSEASKAKKTTTRPSGALAMPKSGGTRVNKPLIDLPKKLGSAGSKMNAKASANASLYAKQQKAAQAKKKGMK